MKKALGWAAAFGVAAMVNVPSPAAQEGAAVPIEERARGAARVVVATVSETTARQEKNEFGDDLIVTYAMLSVEEALKGPAGAVTFALEGGTINGITLRVSSLPTIDRGERAIFFLAPGKQGEFRPHLRGQGILKLDATNRVNGSGLTLEHVRQLVASTSK